MSPADSSLFLSFTCPSIARVTRDFKSELTVPGRYWPWIMKPLWGFVARAPEFVSAQRLAILASARFGPRSVDACETAVGLHYCAGSAGHAHLLVEAWRRDACLEDVGHVSCA